MLKVQTCGRPRGDIVCPLNLLVVCQRANILQGGIRHRSEGVVKTRPHAPVVNNIHLQRQLPGNDPQHPSNSVTPVNQLSGTTPDSCTS